MAAIESIATKWTYDFSEGLRELRELLGGKGAGIAEMTRVLGRERVPGGFTITTAACVLGHRADEPRSLRIVQDHDIRRTHEPGQLDRIGGQGPLVARVLVGAERTAVSIDAVQVVVQALGDHEEVAVAGDHHPARVDAAATGVAEQGRSSSTTPPPLAVEFTFQITRPRSLPAARWMSASSSLY
jgi:hypothetical protein